MYVIGFVYYSKGTCEGWCTTVRAHVRVGVLGHRVAPGQNPCTYLHCTPPHTLPNCTPSTHTPSLHSTHPHTLTVPSPPTHTPQTHSSSLQIQGAEDSPKLCPPQSLCGTVSGSLPVCWGRLVPQEVQGTYVPVCACVCLCVRA